jgi:carbon storage regulator
MLVLSRTFGERIVIGDDVEVTVLEISGNKVRVGVSAPVSIPIKRLPERQPAMDQRPAKLER